MAKMMVYDEIMNFMRFFQIYMFFFNFFLDPGNHWELSQAAREDPEAGRRGPGCQNLAFQRFDPMILCSCLWRIRWTTLESHRTKQMMVYEQNTLKTNIFFL